jgi:AmmeMemoRadiSam system protein B/AmmeMemoRadiSam system protein A
MGVVRPPAVAGSFYPGETDVLKRDVHAMLAAAQVPQGAAVPKAIIVPHAGFIYSGPIAASAYARLAPARYTITRVVLIGPAHRVAFSGIAVSTADGFDTPLGRIPVDKPAVARIATLPGVGGLDQAHAQEHSLEVQLPFLQAALDYFMLVPMVAGNVDPDQVADVLDALWGGNETLIVISSDLSHYLDYAAARRTDGATRSAIERLDATPIGFEQACGRVGVAGLLKVAKRRGLAVETLDVRNSGDTAGPRDRVVGYGAWAFTDPAAMIGLTGFEAQIRAAAPTLTALARTSLTLFTRTGKTLELPAQLPAVLKAPGGAFVTIKREGKLRGCIGSPTAWRSLAEDVIDNAVKAGHGDPRFPHLTEAELDGLELSVSVLTPHEAMVALDEAALLRQLRPHIDGLLIKDGKQGALFLPSVWEQLPEAKDFLRTLKAKAGMAPDHWSASFQAWRFQAVEVR